jgi:YVTN family beta-propeller protein
MPARVSSRIIAVLLFLMTVFLISSGSPPQPFVTSFASLSGQAIVSSNDQCEPGSLVHCIGRQSQENGLGNNNTTAAITTSSESSDTAIGRIQHRNGLGTPAGLLYIGNAKSNSVSVLDLATNAIIKNITVGKSPHDIKISDDQQTVYTTDIDSGTVSIINATSNTLIDQIETGRNRAVHGIAIFNDTLYVGDVYGGKVLVIKNGQIKNEIKVGLGPEYIEVSPDGRFLYVANLWSPISVVDIAQNKVIKEIDSGATPHGLSFSDDGSRLFIVNMKSNTLSVIDATRHEVIKTLPVGDRPEYVALTPDERFAIVTNLGSDTISIVDAKALQVVKEIPVGSDAPHGIAFSADGDMAYISNMNSSDISVINMTTDQVTATFLSGGIEPHQIVLKKPSISIASVESQDNDNKNINATAIPIAEEVYVDIANHPWEHARGLMFKKNLERNNGMLFVYEDDKTRSFWMKNTSIPLDMLFVNSNLTIVDIKENMQPCMEADSCPSYISKQPARFVLELNAGFVQNKTVNVGDHLVLNVDDNNNNGPVPRDNEAYFDTGKNFDGSAAAVAAARQFLISKLPQLGIQLQAQSMLHTDMVVAISEYEYQVDFGVIDAQGRSHEGYVEVSNGQVIIAKIDGKTIFSSGEAL